MPRGRLLVSWGGSALVLGLAISACGDDDSGDAVVGREASYQLLFVDGWTLKEAFDPPADYPLTSLERPPLDWYAEYERLVPSERFPGGTGGLDLRLSGHLAAPTEAADRLAETGFVFTADGAFLVGRSPDGPAIVLVEQGDGSTLMLLSYALDGSELLDMVPQLSAVDDARWVAAGGIIGAPPAPSSS